MTRQKCYIINNEQTNKNIFTYMKTHYGEVTLAKRQRLEKAMYFVWGINIC